MESNHLRPRLQRGALPVSYAGMVENRNDRTVSFELRSHVGLRCGSGVTGQVSRNSVLTCYHYTRATLSGSLADSNGSARFTDGNELQVGPVLVLLSKLLEIRFTRSTVKLNRHSELVPVDGVEPPSSPSC